MVTQEAVLLTGGLTPAGFADAFVLAQPSQTAVILSPDNVEVVALGQSIYADQCAACHGARLHKTFKRQ